MREPGGLEALGENGRRAWTTRVRSAFSGTDATPFVVARPDRRTRSTTAIDWPGAPLRAVRCLSRRRAHELLDWPGDRGDAGRRLLHEEYVEWRVVRDARDRIRRVELTTELGAYWCTLAAHAPRALLATVAELAGERAVPAAAVYGDLDPFARSATPSRRQEAFAAAMIDRGATSPYNTGERAICCMVQPTNTLSALVRLVAAAAVAREVSDARTGRVRCPSAAEAIPLFPNSARQDRASDPLIAERVGRLAWEGRVIAFDDPVGVYVGGVEHTRLRRPDGRPIPKTWFRFGRGVAPRFQRLTLEVPRREGLTVSDLVDVATGEPIRFGAQIAELVQLVLHLRVSAAGEVETGPCEPVKPSAPGSASDCADILRAEHEFARAR